MHIIIIDMFAIINYTKIYEEENRLHENYFIDLEPIPIHFECRTKNAKTDIYNWIIVFSMLL